jgi:hypothetical protein
MTSLAVIRSFTHGWTGLSVRHVYAKVRNYCTGGRRRGLAYPVGLAINAKAALPTGVPALSGFDRRGGRLRVAIRSGLVHLAGS